LWEDFHKNANAGENHYNCDICGKTFTQIGQLSKHNLIHMDEKPYKCDT